MQIQSDLAQSQERSEAVSNRLASALAALAVVCARQQATLAQTLSVEPSTL